MRKINGMRVVEATNFLYIRPTEEDFKNAIPGDPSNCVYAVALKRHFGVTNVYVFRTKAYVQAKEIFPQLKLRLETDKNEQSR